jgi:hypothetical protein
MRVTDAAQSSWTWSTSYSGSIVADVAYDLFTSATSGGANAYEIMIWLANYNAGPISYSYGSNGQPTPVASGVSLAGHTWCALPANGVDAAADGAQEPVLRLERRELRVFVPPHERDDRRVQRRRERVPQVPHAEREDPELAVPHHAPGGNGGDHRLQGHAHDVRARCLMKTSR